MDKAWTDTINVASLILMALSALTLMVMFYKRWQDRRERKKEVEESEANYISDQDRLTVIREAMRTGKPVAAYKDDHGVLHMTPSETHAQAISKALEVADKWEKK